ncbi:MAG: hypothetical protein FWH23_02625 [Bacteroidales bacterium]|nr:hypothetical protein [Bacteroidales bacterium]MCL2133848.1 hypothetical protein [Bacteroidales bacterium]
MSTVTVTINGKIDHAVWSAEQTATVSFNRFPASIEEFLQVREQIGNEPHGAIALQVMAYEMYSRDKTLGKECIELNNLRTNVNQTVSRLNELNRPNDTYSRPYQMAAYLKGASWQNGYTPDKPYTVTIRTRPGVKHENSNTFQAMILYLDINVEGGKDKVWSPVSVVKTLKPGEPSEGKYFIVNDSCDMYSQVREVSFAKPFEGLD